MSKKLVILTVDPGLNGTGWAVWDYNDMRFIDAGIIKPWKNLSWQDEGQYILRHLLDLREQYDIPSLYIEYPAFFGSAGGQVTAASGALVKLSWLVGLICGGFHSSTKVFLTPVNEWKGQLPKSVVSQRIIAIDSQFKKYKSHAHDAIGIGLYVRGDFK
jgi:Holliday junction resolvasome RuvABC endonuclease subunit